MFDSRKKMKKNVAIPKITTWLFHSSILIDISKNFLYLCLSLHMNSLSCKSKLKTIKREKLLENNEICIVIPCSFNTNYDICRNPTITINLAFVILHNISLFNIWILLWGIFHKGRKDLWYFSIHNSRSHSWDPFWKEI